MIKYKDKKTTIPRGEKWMSSHFDKNKKKIWEVDRLFLEDEDDSSKGELYFNRIGSGAQGDVYALCKKSEQPKPCGMMQNEYTPCEKCEYVMKIYNMDDFGDKPDFNRLPLIYKMCSEMGLSSPIVDSWQTAPIAVSLDPSAKKRKKMVYLMKRFNVTLKQYFYINNESYVQQYCGLCKALLVINKMHNMGIAHRDTKPENFMFDMHEKIYAIDLDISEFLDKKNIDDSIFKIYQDYFIMHHFLKFLTNYPPNIFSFGGTSYYLDIIKEHYQKKILDPLNSLKGQSISFEKIIEIENKAVRNFIESIPIPSKEFLRKILGKE